MRPPVQALAAHPPPPPHATAQKWLTNDGDEAQKVYSASVVLSHRAFYERDVWGSLLLTCASQVLTLHRATGKAGR